MAQKVRLAVGGGAIALAVSLGLSARLIAVGNAIVIVGLIPGFAGGFLAVVCPKRPRLLILSAGLLLVAVLPGLFSGLGLLYLPPGAMFLLAADRMMQPADLKR
jgi:hypothetical protein